MMTILRPLAPAATPFSLALGLAGALLIAAVPAAQAQTPAPSSVDRGTSYYHYGLAHIYEELATEQGRPDYATQAVEEYKLALNADPNSTYLQTGLADLYFKIGRIREAVLAAQDQIKKDPNNVEAHVLLGRIYLRSLGDGSGQQSGEMLNLAIHEYEIIIRLQPDNVENHLLLGQLYALNHDSDKAELQFKAAQQTDPNAEEATLNLARLYSEQGDFSHAVNILNSVPVTDRSARMEMALGALYDQLKQPKNAVDAYRLALDQEPDNTDVQRGLATALLSDQQYNAALDVYRKIVAVEPQDAQSYIRISEILRHNGKYEESLATLDKAEVLVRDPLDLNYIRYGKAVTNEAMGHNDAAIAILEEGIKATEHTGGQYTDAEKNNRAAFIDNLAGVYRQQNKTADAVNTYKLMIALGGDLTVRGYQGIIDSYRDAREWQKSTEAAAAAVAAVPDDSSLKLVYAGQLADTGKVEEGLALAKAQSNGKNDREVHIALAQMYMRLRRWKDAAAELDAVDKLSSKTEDKEYLYFLRGSLAERQKHFDEAETNFRKVLELNPNSTMTQNYLGYMLADHGTKLEEARALIQKAVDAEPTNGAYLDSLGWAYFRLGQYTLAEENLRKATELLKTDPTVHDHLGQVYEKTGKLKLAAAQWERSVAESSRQLPADNDPEDLAKVQKRLESAKVKLAKETPSQASK